MKTKAYSIAKQKKKLFNFDMKAFSIKFDEIFSGAGHLLL